MNTLKAAKAQGKSCCYHKKADPDSSGPAFFLFPKIIEYSDRQMAFVLGLQVVGLNRLLCVSWNFFSFKIVIQLFIGDTKRFFISKSRAIFLKICSRLLRIEVFRTSELFKKLAPLTFIQAE